MESKDKYYIKKYWYHLIRNGVFNFIIRQFYYAIFMFYYKKK